MKKKISLSSPNIFKDSKKYILNCINKKWISSWGKYTTDFEKKIKNYTKSKNVVVCSSGTAALHISLILSSVKKNDEIIVPTLTFIATINVINYLQASPIFMDSDEFFNIDVDKTIQFIENHTILKRNFTYNKKTGKRISAIIPVHIWGNAANLQKLLRLCKSKNIKIIEDASESLGTFYNKGKIKGKHTGTIGNFGCISFNGNKIITTGGGGAILTNKYSDAKKARYLISQAKDDGVRFIHNQIGYNYSISNLHAAIGLSQINKIKYIKKLKLKISDIYRNRIKDIPGLKLNESPNYADNNRWLNILKIDKKIYKKLPQDLLLIFKKNYIETRFVWQLNHLQKQFKKCQTYKIENSIKLIKNSLCLPSSSDLSAKDINRICNILEKNR